MSSKIDIEDDELKALWLLAEKQGVTLGEALRRAIATESFAKNHLANGMKFFIFSEDGNFKEIGFVNITKQELQ